jgi:hypothetical protein
VTSLRWHAALLQDQALSEAAEYVSSAKKQGSVPSCYAMQYRLYDCPWHAVDDVSCMITLLLANPAVCLPIDVTAHQISISAYARLMK